MQYFKNAKIFSDEGVFYEAMGVENGFITWLGRDSELEKSLTNSIDLKGCIVIPTFVDSHTHPDMVAQNMYSTPCLSPAINSIEEIINALKTSVYCNGDEKLWIEGYGYDEATLAEKRSPTCYDLDKVSSTQPVMVFQSSFHIISCNSKALQIAGITRDTLDPERGKIGRFENGEPNGIFYEPDAINLIRAYKPSETFESLVEKILALGKRYDSLGIRVVADMYSLHDPFDRIKIYQEARKRGFNQGVVLYYEWADIKKNGKQDFLDEHKHGDIRVGGIKLFVDGSISGRTAFMSENYPDDNHRGMKILELEDLLEALNYARRNHIQVSIHSMGDASIDFLIQSLKDEKPWMGEYPSVRIEHASIISEDNLKQLQNAAMSFALCPQPIFLFAEFDAYRKNLAPNLLKLAYGIKSYDKFVLTALSSDAPATLWADPENLYVSLRACVDRVSVGGEDMNKSEAIGIERAILLHTLQGGKVCGIPKLGRIEKGYEASFQILDTDIFTISPNKLDSIKPKEVYMKGNRVC